MTPRLLPAILQATNLDEWVENILAQDKKAKEGHLCRQFLDLDNVQSTLDISWHDCNNVSFESLCIVFHQNRHDKLDTVQKLMDKGFVFFCEVVGDGT